MIITIYRTKSGNEPFIIWFQSLDKDAQRRIRQRLSRIELGHLGDHKRIGNKILEFRLNFGPGYRIYCSQVNNHIIILLGGGNKRTQKTDINKAKFYLYDITRSQKNKTIS